MIDADQGKQVPSSPMARPDPNRLLTLTQVAEVAEVPRSTVKNWAFDRLRHAPPFPAPAQTFGNVHTYRWKDIAAWLKAAGIAHGTPK